MERMGNKGRRKYVNGREETGNEFRGEERDGGDGGGREESKEEGEGGKEDDDYFVTPQHSVLPSAYCRSHHHH